MEEKNESKYSSEKAVKGNLKTKAGISNILQR